MDTQVTAPTDSRSIVLDVIREVAQATAERIADEYGQLGLARVWADRRAIARRIAADYAEMLDEEHDPGCSLERVLAALGGEHLANQSR